MPGPVHRLCSIAVLACLLLPGLASTAEKLETYTLRQRQAGELIPIIRPMLPPGSAINGQAYTLIVRGDEAAHAVVRQVLQKLDGKLHNLRVSVRFTAPDVNHSESSGARLRLHARDDDAQLHAEIGKTPPGASATLITRGKNGSARIAGKDTYRSGSDDSDYHLRVLEGRAAFVQTGTTIPYGTQTIYPGGSRLNSVQFHDVRSGFYVRPRLNGEQVLLDILPHQQQPAGDGRIDTQHVRTTVSGKLGQWIALGGVSASRQRGSNQALYTRTDTQNKNTTIYVRVEIIQ
jgi:type II secretory pathway component GspD/PulD (secretin)